MKRRLTTPASPVYTHKCHGRQERQLWTEETREADLRWTCAGSFPAGFARAVSASSAARVNCCSAAAVRRSCPWRAIGRDEAISCTARMSSSRSLSSARSEKVGSWTTCLAFVVRRCNGGVRQSVRRVSRTYTPCWSSRGTEDLCTLCLRKEVPHA